MLINAYCTVQSLPPLTFPHRLIGQRDRSDKEMLSHLDGFLGYLFPEGAQMDGSLYALMRHVQRVAHQLSLEIEDADVAAFGDWLNQAHGIAFLPDGSVTDPAGRTLFHPESPADEHAQLPVSEKALNRRSANLRRLQSEGISVPAHLPPIIDEDECFPQSAEDVARRALALFLVALRAESLAAAEPIPVADIKERQPIGFAALSPAEQTFMQRPKPSEEEIAQMSWRYEALQILLWSLGLVQLPPASGICDVSALVGYLLEAEEEEIVKAASLRQPSILLDTLDLHYCYHWAVRQAELGQAESPGGLEPGVVIERHYALNWLTRFEDAPWDDVDTPT